MNLRPWSTAATMTLLLSGATVVFAQDGGAEGIKRHCNAPKPFREVAQDEIATIAELCTMGDGYSSSGREVTAPTSARGSRQGEELHDSDVARSGRRRQFNR